MLQLLEMYAQGQGNQEIHNPKHGRIRRYSYVLLDPLWSAAHAKKRLGIDKMVIGDISDASVFTDYAVPKMYLKLQYCVSCAIHGKIVRYDIDLNFDLSR